MELTCPYCGKTGFKNNGGLNLHKYRCKENPKSKENVSKAEKVKESKNNICPDCGAEMRLLKESNPDENDCINQGYQLVCDECQEIV